MIRFKNLGCENGIPCDIIFSKARNEISMKPNKLKRGDTIGVIAPSNSIQTDDKSYIDKSVALFEGLGYKVKFGKHVYSTTLGYSASSMEKSEDINNMFADKEVSAIFCVKGGCNSNSVFDYLDYNLIANNPKILCGFSDSTSLTNVISLKTGLTTFNGPTFKSLTSWETDYSFNEVIKRFIDGNLDLGNFDDEFSTLNSGKSTGKLIGGNLSLTTQMVCGKYSLDFTDKILFIEDLGYESEPTRISSYLYYMKQNGVFDKISGLWIGNYEHPSNISLEQIVLDTLDSNVNFPIIKSNNFGHIDKKTVIPIETTATIDTSKDKKIILAENCVL